MSAHHRYIYSRSSCFCAANKYKNSHIYFFRLYLARRTGLRAIVWISVYQISKQRSLTTSFTARRTTVGIVTSIRFVYAATLEKISPKQILSMREHHLTYQQLATYSQMTKKATYPTPFKRTITLFIIHSLASSDLLYFCQLKTILILCVSITHLISL